MSEEKRAGGPKGAAIDRHLALLVLLLCSPLPAHSAPPIHQRPLPVVLRKSASAGLDAPVTPSAKERKENGSPRAEGEILFGNIDEGSAEAHSSIQFPAAGPAGPHRVGPSLLCLSFLLSLSFPPFPITALSAIDPSALSLS